MSQQLIRGKECLPPDASYLLRNLYEKKPSRQAIRQVLNTVRKLYEKYTSRHKSAALLLPMTPRLLSLHASLGTSEGSFTPGRSITPATCHDLQESAPQASDQSSLSMKQVFAYDSVYLTTPRELHKPSITDHTCILFLVRLPFKPHLISPSCIHPFSPSARPGGMYEAVE